MNQAQATHDARVEEFKAEANTKHDLKIVEERQHITKEFEASYAQTVEHARTAIIAAKKQFEEQAVIEQARFIQLKVEFENYKREMSEKINEAAAQNLSLQDQLDDLQEQLSYVAKVQPASVPKASVPKAEPATNAGVPTFNIATPRAPDASAAKAENEPRSSHLVCWHKRPRQDYTSCSKVALPSSHLSEMTSLICRLYQVS